MSISVKRMKKLLKDDYQIIDIRSAAEIAHGEIPGAVIVAPENVLDNKNIDYSKKLIICCARGEKSEETARLYSRKVTMHKVLKVDLGHGFLIK